MNSTSHEERIANILRPNHVYLDLGRRLAHNVEAGSAIAGVANRAIDELEVEVEIKNDEGDVDYDAEIAYRSKSGAEKIIREVAGALDDEIQNMREMLLQGALDELEAVLVDLPDELSRIASEYAVPQEWHEVIVGLDAVGNLVRRSVDRDPKWVSWFISDNRFLFASGQSVVSALDGVCQLVASAGKKNNNQGIARIWMQALVGSPQAQPHLHAVGVIDTLEGRSRQSMEILKGLGWRADASKANWKHVLSLFNKSQYDDLAEVFAASQRSMMADRIKRLLDKHMENIATAWPHMLDPVSDAIDPKLTLDNADPGSSLRLDHIMSYLEPARMDMAPLLARLSSCRMQARTSAATTIRTKPRRI